MTATDNCGTAIVTFVETTTAGTCSGNYTLTREWTATDECGLTTVHTQTITVQDTMAPEFVEALPTSITIECDIDLPVAEVLTATDNCGTAIVTFNEVIVDGNCINNYDIVRTWTATDECGLTTIHTQTITVQDTTAPVFTSELPQDGYADCNAIPEPVEMTAIDNCGEVTIVFEETEVPGDCSNRYTIIRTWTATDECGNETVHTQTLSLSCEIEIFNAVSADDDGVNDEFFLEGIDCYPNNKVMIFNRWGVKVFETEGYDNVNRVFRGYSDGRITISRGEQLPTGTYFYILEYEYTGEINPRPIRQSGYLYLTTGK